MVPIGGSGGVGRDAKTLFIEPPEVVHGGGMMFFGRDTVAMERPRIITRTSFAVLMQLSQGNPRLHGAFL